MPSPQKFHYFYCPLIIRKERSFRALLSNSIFISKLEEQFLETQINLQGQENNLTTPTRLRV